MLSNVVSRRVMVLLMMFLIGIMVIPAYAGENNEVSVYVTAIMASRDSDFVDPELTFIADEMKTLLAYSSFKKVKKYTVMLTENQKDRITLPQDQDLVISFDGLSDDGKIALHISMGDTLNTNVVLVNGGHMVIGGPEFDDGTLVLLIEAMQ